MLTAAYHSRKLQECQQGSRWDDLETQTAHGISPVDGNQSKPRLGALQLFFCINL